MKPYRIQVNDAANGFRVETVTSKGRKDGEQILYFASCLWAYKSDTSPLPTFDQLIGIIAEGAALMPLGTKKRAMWLSKLPATQINHSIVGNA